MPQQFLSVPCSYQLKFFCLLSSTHHSEEDAKLGVHSHIVSIGEDKVVPTFLLAGENDRNLLGRHRQNREVDAVEFIETAPRARLSQTWKQTQLYKNHYNYQQTSNVPLLVRVVLISHLKQLCFSFFCCFVCNYNRSFKKAFFSASSF